MSEDNEKAPSEGTPPAPKKNRFMLVVVGAVLAIGTSSAAGAVFGPALAKGHAAEGAAKAAPAAEKEEPAAETADLEPLIVDLRESNGELT